jgi:hypothetical protein
MMGCVYVTARGRDTHKEDDIHTHKWGITIIQISHRAEHPAEYIGKVTPLQYRLWPQRGVEVWLYSSKISALEGGEWSAARPGRTLPPGKTRYPLNRRLGGPQGRSGRAEILAPHRDSIPAQSSL